VKTKIKLLNKILSLVLTFVLALGILPTMTYAIVSDDSWYISDDILFVTDKLTSLPQYRYFSINVVSSGELAFADSEVWKYEVINSGTISGGTFQGKVENSGTISGGVFQEEIENRGTISGGTFQREVDNTFVGDISGGSFLSAVENKGDVSGGMFQAEVNNEYGGFIRGGTFLNFVTNNHIITDGTFRGAVTNNSRISGGDYQNGVGNSDRGTIYGGTFSFYISNNGVIIKAKLLGAPIVGSDPQSVIHNVNGEDKPLAYGKDLLSELGEAQEGTAWYTGDTCIGSETVPLSYTQYTLKAHSHNYIYTVSGNTLIETCANGCNHIAKATLTTPDESYTYTGEFIMPAVLTFDENWKGNDGDGYIYTDNQDVGIATVTANPEGKTITTTFEIKAADIGDATVTLNPADGIYDSNEQRPTVSVVWNGKLLTENTDYTLTWDKNGFINADSYTVTVTGKGNFKDTATKTFVILKKEIVISWGGVNFLPYTGQLVLPEATATNLVNGDNCEVLVSVVETVDGAGVNPGKWTARIIGLSNTNYKLPDNSSVPLEVEYTIYANQTAPVVVGVAETVKGKSDGRISGLTTEMEYATEPTSLNSAYAKITDPNMLFAPGKYYVRYAAKDYYYFSPYTEVTVNEGRELTVTLPSANEQIGYTIEADKSALPYEDDVRITLNSKDGYSMTERFAIYNNGIDVTGSFNFATSALTLTSVAEDVKITIADGSFDDTTDPTAEISVENNKWSSFLNNITFDLFFKETQDVTIIAFDIGSGVKSIEYYLSSEKLEYDNVIQISDWNTYNGTFKINPDNKYVIYAKITDNGGNILYINSDGIVLDNTAPELVGLSNGEAYYGDKIFKALDDYFDSLKVDGVDITAQMNGDCEYKIVADNAQHTVTATDKLGNVIEYKITVYKNYTVTYKADGQNVSTETVGHGKDAALPEVPHKDGFVGKWDSDGKNITGDTTISAVYTENSVVKPDEVEPEDKIDLEDADKPTGTDKPVGSPQTGDSSNIFMWIILLFVSGGLSVALAVVDRKRKHIAKR